METFVPLKLPRATHWHYLSDMTRPCAVNGCSQPAHARGWCVQHYSHFRREGYPGAVRKCSICGQELYGRGRHVTCKGECATLFRKRYRRDWKVRNRERINLMEKARRERNADAYRAYAREWQRKHRNKNRDAINRRLSESHFQKCLETFGLTASDFEALSKSGCRLCGKQESRRDHRTGKLMRLSFDHDHATGKFRGLLCGTCNTRLGWYERRKDVIENYLSEDEWKFSKP